jgi:hypothetical protein
MSTDFLWDEDTTEEETIAGYQELINNGMAWTLEGSVGRTAMALIDDGKCMLGEIGHKSYWGTYVPSRYEVKAGTKGSKEFTER